MQFSLSLMPACFLMILDSRAYFYCLTCIPLPLMALVGHAFAVCMLTLTPCGFLVCCRERLADVLLPLQYGLPCEHRNISTIDPLCTSNKYAVRNHAARRRSTSGRQIS
jgi:hypothetical protein